MSKTNLEIRIFEVEEAEAMHVVTEDRILANTSTFNSLSLYKHQQGSENSELNNLILTEWLTSFTIARSRSLTTQ